MSVDNQSIDNQFDYRRLPCHGCVRDAYHGNTDLHCTFAESRVYDFGQEPWPCDECLRQSRQCVQVERMRVFLFQLYVNWDHWWPFERRGLLYLVMNSEEYDYPDAYWREFHRIYSRDII